MLIESIDAMPSTVHRAGACDPACSRWSLPVPDLSFDLIHAESSVENFSPALDVWEGILYDWDRMLRPGGYAIIRGRIDERDHRLFSQSLQNFTRRAKWEVVQWPKRFNQPAPNAFGEFVFKKSSA